MDKNNAGFSLIEILVVISISSYIVVSLLTSVLRTRINVAETARLIVSDIRLAQANALSSKQFNGTFRCGYGIHMLTSNQGSSAEPFPKTYYLYTTKSNPPTCNNISYQPSDSDIVTNRILDSRLEFCAPPLGSDPCGQTGNFPRFEDIFFEVPKAKATIVNKTCQSNNQSHSQILLRKKDASCPSSSCTYICIYELGKIETRSNPCPTLSC